MIHVGPIRFIQEMSVGRNMSEKGQWQKISQKTVRNVLYLAENCKNVSDVWWKIFGNSQQCVHFINVSENCQFSLKKLSEICQRDNVFLNHLNLICGAMGLIIYHLFTDILLFPDIMSRHKSTYGRLFQRGGIFSYSGILVQIFSYSSVFELH